MHFVDHIFVFLLFVVQPIHGAYSYKKYVKRIEDGKPADRVRAYLETMALEWAAFIVVAGAWYFLRRPIADLGFVSSSTTQIAAGLAVLAVFTVYLLYSWRTVKSMSDERRTKEIDALGTLVHLMPHDARDYRYFNAVSVTAGIVEEFLYRGFAFWYLAHFLPLWAVVLVSSVAFGLGHTYQGAGGVARVTLIGIAFGAFYVFTGSIWLPMLAHAVLDILQGANLLELLRKDDDQEFEQHPDPG
ncbi:MAG: CPBP family intramembrane glutamic endopeptidase [Woeseiaceae bacterium]